MLVCRLFSIIFDDIEKIYCLRPKKCALDLFEVIYYDR
jgi:hypothetical protein